MEMFNERRVEEKRKGQPWARAGGGDGKVARVGKNIEQEGVRVGERGVRGE